MSHIDVDVAIVGAGPAGSTLAALLAKRGVAVALIERDAFPRDKLCGEFLSYDALPVLDLMGVDLSGAPRIATCRLFARRRTFEFPLPHEALGVSRFRLDDLLFRSAVAAGARGLERTTVRYLTSDRVVTGDSEISARVVAGAWGRWGRADTQLHRSFISDRRHRHFGFKRHYVRTASIPDSPSIDLYSFERGYLGVNDVEGGVTNICGLVHDSRLAHHRGRWESFIEMIRAEEPRLETLYSGMEPVQDHFLSSDPVIFRSRSAVEEGIFMLGDASGLIDPLAGNGMAMAIQSALLAAPLILRLLSSGGNRDPIEDEYRTAHRALFLPRIRWSRAVAALLSRPRLLDGLLAVGRSPRLGMAFLRRTRADRDRIARMAEEW